MSENDCMSLDYLEVGGGKTVIMLPGMEGCKEFWRYQWDEFGDRYRVIACTYPVRSPKLSRTISDYACDVLRLMDSLGVEKAAVVGESFGGILAQELAIEHPERVAALVLCNTIDGRRRSGFGLNMFTLATLVNIFVFLMHEGVRKRLLNWIGRHRGFIMDPSPGNDNLADYILEHGLDAGFGGFLDRGIATSKASYTDRLSSISAPTLVLRGVEDRLVGTETTVQLVGRIPGAELVLIDGGGHCCPHTEPEATNRSILEWLDRIDY